MADMNQRPSPQEALKRLLDGNQRLRRDANTRARVAELAKGQAPWGAVVTCADSRLSPALVLDVGLGDLFVCRNAGNIVDDLTLASLEFAVEHFDCRLVAIMGHAHCGAVTAAVKAVDHPGPPNLAPILGPLGPSVLATRGHAEQRDWIHAAARENVLAGCRRILDKSPLVAARADRHQLIVAALWYDLTSGELSVISHTG
jgi:carbonic anhydrase